MFSMTKYYKVISWISLFREKYDIKEIYNIAPGTRFIAQQIKDTPIVMLQCKRPI